jgi:hypothetical protein
MPPGQDCVPLNHCRHTANGFDRDARIVCAAVRLNNGLVISSARHFDPLMREQIKNNAFGPDVWNTAEQGFINSRGQFLTREQAYEMALAHGQIRRRVSGDEGTLYSENLY